MDGPLLASLAAAFALAGLHLLAPHHRHWSSAPRFDLLTFASGAAVGFVLLQLLPRVVSEASSVRPMLALLLASVVGFFGLDRLVKRSREWNRGEGRPDQASLSVFGLAVGLYTVLNAAVGYLLVGQAERGYGAILLLFLAKGAAFLVLDHAFLEDQKDNYARFGRWMVAAADVAGWFLGMLVGFASGPALLLLSILGGAILFNTLKEEVPRGRSANFWPYALGAGSYAALVWWLA